MTTTQGPNRRRDEEDTIDWDEILGCDPNESDETHELDGSCNVTPPRANALEVGSTRGMASSPVGGEQPDSFAERSMPDPLIPGGDAGCVDIRPWLGRSPSAAQPAGLLLRSDGLAMFHEGRVNMVMGEPESGKSWLGLLAVAEVIRSGRIAVVIDLEDGPSGVIERLRSLGLTAYQIADRLIYTQPQTTDHLQVLQRRLKRLGVALILVDSMNELLSLVEVNVNDNTDVTRAFRTYLRPFARLGAAVVVVDHVTKSHDGRGTYPIGAQAKKAALDGPAYGVRMVTPLGRGRTGKLELSVIKDRQGHVRGALRDGKVFGTATLISDPNGDVTFAIEQGERDIAGSPDLLPLMQAISDFLVHETEPRSKNAITEGVRGKTDDKRDALTALERDGYVKLVPPPRGKPKNGLYYTTVKPFDR